MSVKQEDQLYTLAVILAGSVRNLFEGRGVRFTSKPPFQKKPIVEFMHRMRVDGMEKFANPTFISAVNYYKDNKDMEAHKAWGLVVVYIEQEYLDKLLKMLKYPEVDDEDDKALLDACGAVCNIIAGQFRGDLETQGYSHLEMSPFSSHRNNSLSGVEFYFDRPEKYEINFYIKGEKRVVVELSMGPLGQSGPAPAKN